MKILIVARYFSPENTIGAIRPTKFAKYLTRMGHDVSVYACKPEIDLPDPVLIRDAAEISHIYRIGNGRFYQLVHDICAGRDKNKGARPIAKDAAASSAPKRSGFYEKLMDCVYHIMWIWCDFDQYTHYRRYTAEDQTQYDVIFATWRTDAVHRIALDMMKRNRARAYIADFRDAAQSFWPELTKNRDIRRLLSRVFRRADAVTAAFPSILTDSHVPMAMRQEVIFNGFDAEDLAMANAPSPDGKFHLAYCGQLYPWQDFTPLFSALSALIGDGRIDRSRIVIDYAGQSAGKFLKQAEPYQISDVIINHGFLPRPDALGIQLNAQMLLFAAWNSREHPAIFPGKFLEYMMMERPVLCLVAGDVPNSLPERVMREANLGYCACACDASSAQGLSDYLLSQYLRYTDGDALLFEPNKEVVSQYSYPKRAQELEKLMRACCSKE